MRWHERMNQAIDYIESNLCCDIDYEYIAKITFQSVTSFQRTFSVVTEMPISEYIRRRRMDIAAVELRGSKTKVIDISMKYGYESPEAFSRAFREIYGVSPSEAKKGNISLKSFPRLSFLLTIKGEVVMDYISESSTAKIVNTYYEHLPALRLIGKRYTQADLDPDMKFGSKWNEWFQNGWFGRLNELGCLPGYEFTGIFGINIGNEIAYWIGMFFPEQTPVPEGFEYADIPSGVVGMCWIHGYKENGELFTQGAHDLCLDKIRRLGNVVKMDFNGLPCRWSFERYHNERFNIPDNDGKVIVDYGIYLVESEVNQQKYINEKKEEHSSLLKADELSQELMPEMLISDMAPYSVDVESNLLFCALAMLFLKLEGYDESKPYFCARKECECIKCGECGERRKSSSLAQYHLDLYHYLITVTGVGLMWGDPDVAGTYDLKYTEGIRLPYLEDRLDFAMKVKGYEYICLDRTKGERAIFRIIQESIQRAIPVLLKLGNDSEWCVVTGVDEKINAIYGVDSKKKYGKDNSNRNYTRDGLFVITDWMKEFRKAIVITGKGNKRIDFCGQLKRMAERLISSERGVLEALIPQMLASIEVENARGVADYLNQIIGYVIENRWHAAECFHSTLLLMTEKEAFKELLRECGGICYDTHDTCWQIWGLLGVGPHTSYNLPNLISQMLLDKERQEKIKELFARLFNNDHIVLEKLHAIIAGSKEEN